MILIIKTPIRSLEKPMRRILPLLLVSICALLAIAHRQASAADEAKPVKISALILDGQNNHNWKVTTPILKAALESSGLFSVDVATEHKGETFAPDFSKYGVIVSNYNGAEWPEPTKKAFEEYVKNGGGFVCVHAADNSFPKWPEYNRMIGVGGWGDAATHPASCSVGAMEKLRRTPRAATEPMASVFPFWWKHAMPSTRS